MDEATRIKFEQIEAENDRQNARIGTLEKEMKTITQLTISVQRLADNMQHMLEEQRKQGERLEKLEAKPAESWDEMKKTIVNTIVGAAAGALAIGLIQMIATHM